jgi:hypothetical protein
VTTIHDTKVYMRELADMLRRASTPENLRELRLALELIRRAARELDPETLPRGWRGRRWRSGMRFRPSLLSLHFARDDGRLR